MRQLFFRFKHQIIIIFCLTSIFLVLRLYRLNAPLAEFHSWRQADTMAVARNFEREGLDILHPRFDDLSNIQSGVYNPKGYRMVEFPLYNALTAILAKITNIEVHVAGRLVTIALAYMAMLALYYLLKKTISTLTAFWGALFFALMPWGVYYTRTTLPDTSAMSLAIIACAIFFHWYSQKKECFCFVTASILMSAALLIKPTSIFYLLPISFLFFKKFRKNIFIKPQTYLSALIIALPLILWRLHIQNFPEGIAASSWLITSVNTGGQLMNIFMRPAFFRWVFLERISVIITGSVSMGLIILGVMQLYEKSKYLLLIVLSNLIYLFIFQGGNVQHDYYQIMILPSLAICFALGGARLYSVDNISQNIKSTFAIAAIVILSAYLSFTQIKDHYQLNETWVSYAKIINNVVPSDALLATDTVGDTTLLYLANRKGFPAITGSAQDLRSHGITFLTASSPAEINKNDSDRYLKKIFSSIDFAIYEILP